MNVTPIRHPLPSEHLAATWPTMRLDLDDSRPRSNPQWRQRMRFWSGRALTAEALERDQDNRASRLAWLGRMTTAGIVSGLEVALEREHTAFEPLQILNVESRNEIPAEGTRVAIIARVNDALHFRVFDSTGQRVRDVSEEELLANDNPERHRRQTLDHLRPLIADLDSPANPTDEQRQEILQDFGALVDYRLPFAGHFVHVLPGHGITGLGDDVVVPRTLRVDLASIPVRGLLAHEAPWAAVLVVRPAEFGRFDNVDATDSCELDPSQDAFADERRQDAALLELIPLPVAWQADPALANPDDPRWRNQLAHVVFNDQRHRTARQQIRFRASLPAGSRWDTFHAEDDRRPWELNGVPLALLASELAPDGERRLFLDRGSVARPGGKSRPRLRPGVRLGTDEDVVALNLRGSGDPALWRARVDQFAEHFAALDPNAPIASQTKFFQFLPPAGLLPKAALEILSTADALAINADDRATSRFFPASIAVEAVPAPIEDLDAALAASAPLAEFDLASTEPDLVRVIVPVPQRVFDPELLVIEREDPFFRIELGRLVAERQDWRQRRDFVRTRQRELQQIATGPLPPFTPLALERGQLEPEPVETSATLGFTRVLLSPFAANTPAELRVAFRPRVALANTLLYVRIRTNNDGGVPPVEAIWRSGAQTFSRRFDTPPDYPLERPDANGQAMATLLWRPFSVRAADLGIDKSADITGFSVVIASGQIAVADAGQLVTGPLPGELVAEPWWRAEESDTEAKVEHLGGEWTAVTGGREFAPFESEFAPTFDDNLTVARRVAELDNALNPPDAAPRKDRRGNEIMITVASDGLEKVLAELDAQANEADDLVDASFTRAQTNLYRIRKLILGETAAQKLLINPAIATIAEQETANASSEKLSSYIAAAKQKPVSAAEANQAITGVAPRATTGTVAEAPRAFVARDLAVADLPRLETLNLAVDTRSTTKSTFALDKSALLQDVFGQRAEPGPTLPPRGLSIGQRFVEPKATDNLAFARSALQRLIDQLATLRLPLVGEAVFSIDNTDTTPIPLLALQGRAKPTPDKTSEQLRLEARDRLMKATPITNATDEAEVTLAALDFTETKSAILRTIEKIILARRSVIQRGRETLAAIRATLSLAQNRVLAIEPRLAEARHDVSVARALRQEESARVTALNARRDTILRDEVRFLAFVRPRAVDPVRRASPGWRLESAEVPGDVPGCLARHDDPPDELRAYLQLFRHAPAAWFKMVAPRLKELNTREKLVDLLNATRQSALNFAALKPLTLARQDAPVATMATLQSAFSIVDAVRRDAARIQISPALSLSWSEHQRTVEKYSSLGDIIDGRHGHPSVAKAAATELENIESVVACLHAEFAGVAPAIRLVWVERYSQFDRPSPLHDLTVLPGFGSLPRTIRRHFQSFVDWLFGRIDRSQSGAASLMNDLVRICLLLASHAPVKQLIAGHVPRPTPVRPGVRIPIRPIDPRLVRVGMEFHVWQANEVVARGLVEDLQDGEVSARVDHVATISTTTTIDQTMRIQFVAPAFSIGSATSFLK